MGSQVVVYLSSDDEAVTVANMVQRAMMERGLLCRLDDVEELSRKRYNNRVQQMTGNREILITTRADKEDNVDNFDWSAYLTNDSVDGMIVKGTLVKVQSIITCIVDGQTWRDILRAHPELNEEDIRACIAYTMNDEAGEYGANQEGTEQRQQVGTKVVGGDDKPMGNFTLHYGRNVTGKECYNTEVCRFPACADECISVGCHAGEAED